MNDAEPTPPTQDDPTVPEVPDPAEFYKIGGTMSGDAASYVLRRADLELLEALSAGEFCYVLTSRQMGKSSLMVRTAGKLREAGASIVLLDLTAFGRNLTPEQWYESLRDRIGRQLHLEAELDAYADQMSKVSPLQRFIGGITDVALQRLPGNLVIFLDEIDYAKSLPFSTDELFSAIRACYNRRVLDAELYRLTFCLLGVASPSDLIRDSRTTPFNVGRRIELTDFTRQEAEPLTLGLRHDPSVAAMVLARVLHWTGGHPYLTQRLCRAAAECHAATDEAVDLLCEELFLSNRARTSDDNLLFAREQMLRVDVDRAALLALYGRILERKRVADQTTNQLISILRLSGAVRSVSGHLTVSNRIYARVFDRSWIDANMPDQERRRQRAAYRRGLLKAGAIAAVIIASMACLAVYAFQQGRNASRQQHLAETARDSAELQRRLAETLKLQAEAQTKVADIARGQAVEAQNLAEKRRKEAEIAETGYSKALTRIEQEQKLLDQAQAIADANTQAASLQLANRLVARGDALASAGRWADAKMNYDDAFKAFNLAHNNGYEADLGLSSVYVHSPPPLLLLPMQESAVTCVALSADGHSALTGASSGSVTLWDLATGTERYAFEGHTGPVQVVAFAPDGRTAVSGSADGSVRTWDLTTGAAIRTLPLCKPANAVPCSFDFYFTRDGGRIASSDADGVKLRDLATGSLIRKIGSRAGRVRVAPDGSSIVVMDSNSAPEVLDLTKDAAGRPLKGHHGGTCDAAYSRDGGQIVTAGYDNTLRLWNVASGSLLKTFQGPTAPVRTVALSSDGSRILAGGDDRSVRVWDIESGREALVLTGHNGGLQACAMSSDGRLAVSGGADKRLIVWSLSNDIEAPLIRGGGGREIAVSNDGRMVTFDSLADDQPGKNVHRLATIFDTGTGLPLFSGNVSTKAQGNNLVILTKADDATPIGTFVVRRTSTGEPGFRINNDNTLVFHSAKGEVPSASAHAGAVKGVRFSTDGRLAVSASCDQTAKVWDTTTGILFFTYRGHTNCVTDATFSPDGTVVASGSSDGTVRIWDAKSPTELRCVARRHPVPDDADANSVEAVNFSPDGRRLFVSYQDRETEIWDFSRPGQIRDMELRLEHARTDLTGNPQDPASLHTLGEWYAMRGVWSWAYKLLSPSSVSAADSAALVRCYWMAGDDERALREVQRVLDAQGPSQGYAYLLRDLILADRPVPKQFKFPDHRTDDRSWLRIGVGTWQETFNGLPQAQFQVLGQSAIGTKPGAFYMRLPDGRSEPEPDANTQVFVSSDVTLAAWRDGPQNSWNVMEPPAIADTRPAKAPILTSPPVAVTNKNPDADLATGDVFFKVGNYAGALKAYQSAAQAGNDKAMLRLAGMYESGKGVAQDPEATRFWYQKSADAGNSEAQRWIGIHKRFPVDLH